MRIFDQKIRTKHQRVTLQQINNGCIVTNTDGPLFCIGSKLLPDLADQSAFSKIAEFHTVASAPLRKRRGPRTTLFGFFVSSKAALKTLLMSSTKMNRISFRMGSFTSSRSRLLSDGKITVSIFARRAA